MTTVTDLPAGYKDIPEEDRKKANVFFGHGRTVADTGNYEYAIEMYLQGLAIDPDATEAHQAMRDISMRRKATGGKPLGMGEKWKLKKGDDKQNMLNAEKLLAYEPGNVEHMQLMITAAQKAGFYDTVLWLGPILFRALMDMPKNDQNKFNKFIALKDVYKAIGEYQGAIEAIAMAMKLKPDDMDLNGELKHLGAAATMKKGNYEAGDFRKSLRDKEGLQKLLESDKDIRSMDALSQAIHDAEQAWKAEPNDAGKFAKLIDALCRTEALEGEARAIELLDRKYKETRQFRFKQRIGQITIAQDSRTDRWYREQLTKNPNDAKTRKEYEDFQRDRAARELTFWQDMSVNYPTDTTARYELGRRQFLLAKYDEAIPVLQQVRNDPKYRVPAGELLGRSFLNAGFADEAADTLQQTINEYAARGDEKSIGLFYWYARAQEEKGDRDAAIKAYSQVAQWNFGFRDVQARIKRLRADARGSPTPPGA